MSRIKGQVEYEKWQRGEKLNRRQAGLALCYECNGLENSNEDCSGRHCPYYVFQPYRGKAKPKKAVLPCMDREENDL